MPDETAYDANWRGYMAADALAELLNRFERDIVQDAASLAALADEIEALTARTARLLRPMTYADVVRSAAHA